MRLELLKMLITEYFMNQILNQTNLYVQQKKVSLKVTKNELWVLFGAFFLSSYASIRQLKGIQEKKSKYPASSTSGCEKLQCIHGRSGSVGRIRMPQ